MFHPQWRHCEELAATLGVGQPAGARERLQESSVWTRGPAGAESAESLLILLRVSYALSITTRQALGWWFYTPRLTETSQAKMWSFKKTSTSAAAVIGMLCCDTTRKTTFLMRLR